MPDFVNLRWRFQQSHLFKTLRAWKQRYLYFAWILQGRATPPPPPVLYKQQLVKQYGDWFAINTFIETGTARGDMLDAQKKNFEQLYSIELDSLLFLLAGERFSDYPHISLYQGDSADTLVDVLSAIEQPALFWLDAHAMVGGVTGQLLIPIRQELSAILSHPIRNHVILIDDARLFVGRSDYPTIEELESQIKNARPEWVFRVENDIVRAYKDE